MKKKPHLQTIYESLYDRILDPQILETIIGGDDPDYSGDDRYLNYFSNSADPEIAAAYSSYANSSHWDKAQSSRQVTGFDITHIFENICFQIEYGELNVANNAELVMSDDIIDIKYFF